MAEIACSISLCMQPDRNSSATQVIPEATRHAEGLPAVLP